jgi:hypothetical protein
MGQLIIPTDKKIKGPWLLNNKALEELNESLEYIDAKLNEAFEILVERTAESKLDEFKEWDKSIDILKAKEKVRDSYPFDKSEKYVLLLSKQGKKIKDTSLLSLLKDPQIDEISPSEIRVQFEKGPCKFRLEISTEYEGELETRIEAPDDNIISDINYEINKWINKHKSNIVMQKWSSWFLYAAVPIFMLLLIIPAFFFQNKKEAYQYQLLEVSQDLLKDGITLEEAPQAIEIILKIETEYVPDEFDPRSEINSTIRNIWLIGIIGLIILIIKPKTTIGLGKSKWKVKFYKKWAYFVMYYCFGVSFLCQ